MADLLNDGNIAVWIAPTNAFADLDAPTVAEMGAVGVIQIDDRLTPDGVKLGVGNDKVDTSSLRAKFTTQINGRDTYDPSLTFKNGTTVEENAWKAPLQKGSYALLIIRRNKDAETAVAAADELEIYQVQTGGWQPQDPAPNEVQKIMIPLTVSDGNAKTADDPAVVAA